MISRRKEMGLDMIPNINLDNDDDQAMSQLIDNRL
jgi:hypothetical protein